MKVQIYSSTSPILRLALEEIAFQIRYPFDFVILAISPKYPYKDIPIYVPDILEIKENQYLAFNAIDAFRNTDIIENGVVACFITFERKGSIKKFIKENITNCKFSELVSDTIDYISKNSSLFHIIIADYCQGYFPLFFERLSLELEKRNISQNNICGGITSSFMEDGKRFPGYLFTDRKFIEEGFVILSFENVLAEVEISTGTFKRGPIYTITLGKGFKIYELDGRPAGYLPKALLKNIDGERLEYLWYTPFIIIDGKGNHHAVRTFKSFTDEYIEVWAPIKEGQKVKLSFLIPEEILKDTEKIVRRLKAAIKTADLCLNFSCTARQYTLEDRAKEELIIYGSVINAPLFGFFTHGEIAPNMKEKKLELHNQTSVGIVLKEI